MYFHFCSLLATVITYISSSISSLNLIYLSYSEFFFLFPWHHRPFYHKNNEWRVSGCWMLHDLLILFFLINGYITGSPIIVGISPLGSKRKIYWNATKSCILMIMNSMIWLTIKHKWTFLKHTWYWNHIRGINEKLLLLQFISDPTNQGWDTKIFLHFYI